MSVSVLLAELDRAQTFGEYPPSSRLWLLAPPGVRSAYLNGRLVDAEFWDSLRRWLSYAAKEKDQ